MQPQPSPAEPPIASDVLERPRPRRHGNGRPGGARRRFIASIIAIGAALQLPLIWAIGRLTGHPVLGASIALLLTGGFLSGVLAAPAALGDPSPARLYLVMWPFFVWWTWSLVFAVATPVIIVATLVAGAALDTAVAVALVASVVVATGAFVHRVRIKRRDVTIAGLPAAFDGYRIVQLSDLHCGPFASGRRVARWVKRANRLEGDLVAVTGDLIASGPAFVRTVARELGALAARDGVFAVMGNHDYFVEGEVMADALDEAGLAVLRNRGASLTRGDARLFVAGVDDTWTGRHDVARALEERPEGVTTVLLAHDPALFPEAVERGVDLTLSGHTHGGQLGVPFATRRWNLARLVTPFTTGVYRTGNSTLYVNNGLGTTGLPIRLLVPPEIAVITLRSA
ncbi:MAG TPA: metallophosphoesterase [Polyangia bacterium]|nr:metallophosphoesterase [Polyangia bacterium]